MTIQCLLAGFGGQGLLFAGKVLATAALLAGYEVSWLPSYGPEMRGGTANCSVILSDKLIGTPIVLQPDVLVAMNVPSFSRFEPLVSVGGVLLVDSSMIEMQSQRTDIFKHSLPATTLAEESDLKGLANMILIGKLLIIFPELLSLEIVQAALKTLIPASKSNLLDANLVALSLGMTH